MPLLRQPENAPPLVSTRLPLVGTAVEFGRDSRSFLADCRARYGDVFRLNLLLSHFTVLAGVEEQHQFFDATEDELNFDAGVADFVAGVLGDIYEAFEDRAGPHLMSMLRSGLTEKDRLQRSIDIISHEAQTTFDAWSTRGVISLFESCSRLTTAINIAILLGDDIKMRYGDAIASAYYRMERFGMSTLAMVFPKLPLTAVRRATTARNEIFAAVEEVFNARKALSPEAAAERSDYLQHLLSFRYDDDGTGFTVQDIRSHLLSVMFAAHTNTAGTLSWTLTHIFSDPRIRERARAEVAEVMAAHGGQLNFNSLGRLKYLDACMKETARTYFTTLLVRKALKPYNIGGYTIPAGDLVAISPILLHHDPTLFPEPEVYRPERWLDKDFRRRVTQDRSYVQFGHGPHRCVGARFAECVLKTAMAHFIHHQDLRMLGRFPEPDWAKAIGIPFPKEHARTLVVTR